MKKNIFLTAATALLLNANAEATALRVRMGATYELDGGFYASLANFVQGQVKGLKVTARAHGPRMGELYNAGEGNLNTVGIHLKFNREITAKEREKIAKALRFYINNVTVVRTIKVKSKNRQELRDNSTLHKVFKDGLAQAAIETFVIAF